MPKMLISLLSCIIIFNQQWPGIRRDKKGDQLPKRLTVVIKVKGAHVKFRLD